MITFFRFAGIFLFLCVSAHAVAEQPMQEIPKSVAKKICADKFAAGELSLVSVLQSADGRRRVYLLQPDRTRFSHTPFIYFDDNGKKLLTVPEFPITPGPKPPILEKRDTLVNGLEKVDSFSCSETR